MSDLEQSVREILLSVAKSSRRQPTEEGFVSLAVQRILAAVRRLEHLNAERADARDRAVDEMLAARREVERLKAENSKFREALTEILDRHPGIGKRDVPGLIARSALKDAE